MIKRFPQLFYREFGGLHKAALILAVSSVVSALLGLFRDHLLAGTFGAGKMLDIYYAAFKIPDFLYTLSLAIASVTVLIPFFLKKISSSQKEAQNFLDSIFTIFILAMIFFIALTFLSPPL